MIHSVRRSAIAALLLLSITARAWAAAPTISSTSPTLNQKNIAASANISIAFDQSMDNASLNSTNIKVYGSLSGFHTGSVSVSVNTATFDPASNFIGGEAVTVVVTTGVKNSGLENMASPYITTFIVASSGEAITKNGTTKSTGTSPNNVILVDVNNDGDLDIVSSTGNGSSVDSVSILSNTGGSFSDPSAFVTGAYPTSVSAGDFDGANGMDLVVTNYTDGDISVFLNNGSGTFSRTDYAAQSGPVDAVAGDLDGDGDLDIAVHNRNTPSVSVFLNNGSGSFAAAVNYGSGTTNMDLIRSVDIDGDHDIDIVTGGAGMGGYVLKNNGDGTLAAAVSLGITGAYDVHFADVDGDGDADMIAAMRGSNKISVYLNTGSGTFGSATDYTVPNANAITTVDLGGDGDLDILATDVNNAKVYVLKNASGTFTNSGTFNVGTTPENTVFGDLNADGHLDVVTANRGANSATISNGYPLVTTTGTTPSNNTTMAPGANITVTFNVAMNSGTMTSSTVFVLGSMTGRHSGSISYDGPSKTMTFNPAVDFERGEAVSVTLTTGIQSAGGTALTQAQNLSFTVASGTGPGFFSATTVTNHFSKSESRFLSADVDNDGDADLIGWGSGISVSKNNGSGFDAPVTNSNYTDISNDHSLRFGDIDGDGYGDIIAARTNSSQYIVIFKNNGSGAFSLYDSINTNSTVVYHGLEVKDFNNDGKLDIAYYAYNASQFKIAYNSTGWTSHTAYSITAGNYRMTSGDVDNDGDVDLMFAAGGVIRVVLNNGDETFASAVTYTLTYSTSYIEDIVARDFNGDGYLDIMTMGGNNYNAFAINLNNGNGTFASETAYTLSIQPAVVRAGDLDGDGDVDLAFCYQNVSGLDVAYNNGTGQFPSQLVFPVRLPGFTMMDFDADGDLDMVGKDYLSNVDLKILVNSAITTPSVSASGVTYSNDFGSTEKIDWTKGDGTGRIVVMRSGAAVTWTPTDNTTYTANASFGTGTDLGNGHFVIFNGVSATVNVSNLALSTTYHVAVFEYNGLPGSEKYKTSSPATGSDQTNSVDGYPFATTPGSALSYSADHWDVTDLSFSLGTAFSIELWVKPAAIGSDMVILTHGEDLLWIGIDASGHFYGRLFDEDLEDHILITGSTTTAVADQWYHVALTGANDEKLKLYVNGGLEVQSGDNIGYVSSSSANLWPGGDWNNTSYNGQIDELRLWGDVRTAEEIRVNMHKTLSGAPSGIVGYWQFNEGSGTSSVEQVSGNTMYSDDSFIWVTSTAPVGGGSATTASVAANTTGTQTIGPVTLNMTDGFDDPTEVVVSAVTAAPNSFPANYSSSVGSKYFIIDAFPYPSNGTFSTSLTLNFGTGVLTDAVASNYILYKRGSSSTGAWTSFDGATTVNTATGLVTWTNITSFSQAIVVNVNDALPVELTSFTANTVNGAVELLWKTATEVNNAGFEIERSAAGDKTSGGNAWTRIGSIDGHGTTNAPQEYSFTDRSARGTQRYRLKQIDRDGRFTYSQTVEVTSAAPAVFALSQNYPNPFNPSTTIEFTLQTTGWTTLKIDNTVGQEVATLVNDVREAGVYHQQRFDAGKLSSGVYFARLSSGGLIRMMKMTLIK